MAGTDLFVRWRFFISLLLVWCLSCAEAHAASVKTLHLLLADPVGTALDLGAHRLQAEVARVSHGRLTLDVRAGGAWNGAPISELGMLRSVHDGEAEMAIISTAPLSNYDPDFQILDVPFLFGSAAEVDKLVDGPDGRDLLATLPAQGFRGLAFWDSGFRVLASQRRWQTLEDLKTQRVRVMESDIYQVFMRLLGARPIPVGSNEVHKMVVAGYLDAVDMAYASLLEHRVIDVYHYILETRHIDEQKVVLVNDRIFQQLSAEEKTWLSQAAWTTRLVERRIFRSEEGRTRATMRARGVLLTALSPSERARMKSACQPLYHSLARTLTRPWEQTLLLPPQ